MDVRERLKAALQQWEEEFRGIQDLEPAVRHHLENVSRELRAAVEELGADSQESPTHRVSRFREMVERFEAEHPTVAGFLTRLVDALAQLGI
ncbi:MAG: hypothetical protein KatS3mg110_4475 [Pirellulaceae bacterium]|nr:MAG: hypothetical protein KatS3mg110_4475 [Pirellulaceae bacterium]